MQDIDFYDTKQLEETLRKKKAEKMAREIYNKFFVGWHNLSGLKYEEKSKDCDCCKFYTCLRHQLGGAQYCELD